MFSKKINQITHYAFFGISIALSFFISNQAKINNNISNNSILKKDKVMCVTIPKSGTHLLLKCLTLMGIKDISYDYWVEPKVRYFNDLSQPVPANLKKAFASRYKKAFERHLPYTPESEKFFSERCFASFFMIRDPRAQLISQAKTFQAARIGGKKRSIENFALDMLLNRKENFLPLINHLKHKNLPEHVVVSMADLFIKLGFEKFYKMFTPWMKAKNFYTVKFENLVGDKGGGSRTEQIKEIKAIAQQMGVTLSNTKINAICDNLFGDSGTFRQGQIDSWKKYFTPAIKSAFKSQPYLMKLLIDLGYEKDNNW